MSSKFVASQKIVVLIQIMNFLFQNVSPQEIKHTLRVASDLRPRFLTKLGENGRYERYKGFVKDFLEELLNILGFEYEIVLAKDHRPSISTRVNFTSGYWDGVIGMLVRNEADLAFGETEVTMERAQVVDFSMPVLTTRFSVLHKFLNEPRQTVTHNQWTIFSPFSISVWIPFSVVAVLYLVFLKAHQFRTKSVRFRFIQKLKHSKKFAAIVLAVWTLLLFTSYVSNYTAQKVLVASLVSKMPKFSGLVDISSQKDIKIGWLARGPVDEFFKDTLNELYQKVYIRNIGRDWISSIKEGVNKVLKDDGKFAFILDSFAANHEALLDCSLYTLPQEFGPTRSFAVATPIGSPLRERIDQAVLSLSEQGIIESLELRWFSQTNFRCSQDSMNTARYATTDASVHEMSPVFIIAVLGLFIATVIGFWEMHLLNKSRRHTAAPQAKPPRQQSELLPKFNLEVV